MQLNCFDCCTITMTGHKLREHMASRVRSQKAQSWKAVKAKKTIRNPETINPCDTYLFVGSGLHKKSWNHQSMWILPKKQLKKCDIAGAISWSSISLKTSCSRWSQFNQTRKGRVDVNRKCLSTCMCASYARPPSCRQSWWFLSLTPTSGKRCHILQLTQ